MIYILKCFNHRKILIQKKNFFFQILVSHCLLNNCSFHSNGNFVKNFIIGSCKTVNVRRRHKILGQKHYPYKGVCQTSNRKRHKNRYLKLGKIYFVTFINNPLSPLFYFFYQDSLTHPMLIVLIISMDEWDVCPKIRPRTWWGI